MNNDTKEISANQLADYLNTNVDAEFACEQVHIDEAATMLRQQQAEIELLQKHIEGWKEDYIKQSISLAKTKSELEIANAMLDTYEWCKK